MPIRSGFESVDEYKETLRLDSSNDVARISLVKALAANCPDFLPPDPRFGATADFRTFLDAAHSRGLLVMPYTNPTWWDDKSPTARSVPDIAVLAVLGQDAKPVYESYGPNRGFVTSPQAPGVQGRLSALMAQWRDEAPVNLVFQDQIGSRSWIRDFNAAPADPQSQTPPRGAGGLMTWAVSRTAGPWV